MLRIFFKSKRDYRDLCSGLVSAKDWNDHMNVCIALTRNFPLRVFTLCEGFFLLNKCIVILPFVSLLVAQGLYIERQTERDSVHVPSSPCSSSAKVFQICPPHPPNCTSPTCEPSPTYTCIICLMLDASSLASSHSY